MRDWLVKVPRAYDSRFGVSLFDEAARRVLGIHHNFQTSRLPQDATSAFAGHLDLHCCLSCLHNPNVRNPSCMAFQQLHRGRNCLEYISSSRRKMPSYLWVFLVASAYFWLILIDQKHRKKKPSLRHLQSGYGTLSADFVYALQHWKSQRISFLDLPGEIRNQIYRLVIYPWKDKYVELPKLHPRASHVPSPLSLMHTCRQVQREVTALYFPNITLSLRLDNDETLLLDKSALSLPISETLAWYKQIDPAITHQFHTMSLELGSLTCRMLVTNSKIVCVQLSAFGRRPFSDTDYWTSPILTEVSLAIRDNIIRSLATSPTGLLGFRHFAMAEEEVRSLLDWHAWMKQESKRHATKSKEAPWGKVFHSSWCDLSGCYDCYMIAQAEEEGLPRLIAAVSVEDPGLVRRRILWKRDEETQSWRKATEAEHAFPEKLMWSYEDCLIKEAEKEGMPRSIRAAPSPLDELEMNKL